MILGAIDDSGNSLQGHYKPAELGKLTVWQMKNLFGYRNKPRPVSEEDAYWLRCRILGMSEFEIWCKRNDEVKPMIKAMEKQNAR